MALLIMGVFVGGGFLQSYKLARKADKEYSDLADAVLHDAPIHPAILPPDVSKFETHQPATYSWK